MAKVLDTDLYIFSIRAVHFRELSLITFGVGLEGKQLGHEIKIDNTDGL